MCKYLIILLVCIFNFSYANAQNYNLKRAVLTYQGGITDDSAVPPFSATGSMSIIDGVIRQNVTYCKLDDCAQVVENGGGEITEVLENAARVSITTNDGVKGDLTILSLFPNVITLFVYEDGSAETHEWESVP